MFKVEDGEEIIKDIIRDTPPGYRRRVEATKSTYDQLINLPRADEIDFVVKDIGYDNQILLIGGGSITGWGIENYTARKVSLRKAYRSILDGDPEYVALCREFVSAEKLESK